MLPRNLLLAIVTMSAGITLAQNSRLIGMVRDSITMEALANVEVVLCDDEYGVLVQRTTTNRLGNFLFLHLLPGIYTVEARGFQRTYARRTIGIADSISERRVELLLGTASVELGEIIVRGENVDSLLPATAYEIEPQLIRTLPAMGGEPDVFRPLYFLPGVTIGSELLGGLHVRGSSPGQNLVMLDGMPLLNPTHFGGLISVFNPDILGSARLSKELLDVSCGGRAASLLELNTREPSRSGLAGSAGISLLSSRLTLEVPLTDNIGVMVSGRRLYADLIVPIVANPVTTPLYYFYDANAKLVFHASAMDRVVATFYLGRDVASRSRENADVYFDIAWGNTAAALRWSRVFSSSVFLSTALLYSSFSSSATIVSSLSGFVGDWYSNSRTADLTARADLDITFAEDATLTLGAELTRNAYRAVGQDRFHKEFFEAPSLHASDAAGYARIRFSFGMTRAEAGLRLASVGNGAYTLVEPRGGLSVALSDAVTLRASAGVLHQYLQLVTRPNYSFPTDFWLRADERIRPAKALQLAAGLEWLLPYVRTRLAVDGYYKRMWNLYEYRPRHVGLSGLPDDRFLVCGRGEAYGMEAMLHTTAGKLSGWLAYTLSWTRRFFEELNGGKPFYPQFDQRHIISLVGTFKASERWTLSATWSFSSGRPYTLPTGMFTLPGRIEGIIYLDFPAINDRRLPAYHRLDVGATYAFYWFGVPFQLLLSVSNVYNRQNVFARYIRLDRVPTDREYIYQYDPSVRDITMFPILPTIGLSCTF
ncbi:MAG TPA: TonB-dependent receptor [Bacteroidota bacterium]|nr:TonB-dependent receptor [Bacteroidota bacterium]